MILMTLLTSFLQQTTPEVDEEGYRIRPDITDNNGDKNSWYSSDSDSDSGQYNTQPATMKFRGCLNLASVRKCQFAS